MISPTFNIGNYNDWDTFVRITLPNSIDLIEQVIISQIDTALLSMLGNNARITKESINVTQQCDRDHMEGIVLDIIYIVEDFKVPDAPDKAILADTEAIKGMLISGDDSYTLNEINIDVNQGTLTLQFYIPFVR